MTRQINPTAPPRAPKRIPDTTGQAKSAPTRAAGRTTLVLTFSPSEADTLRRLCESLKFANGKTPSMALVARRSLAVYRTWASEFVERPAVADAEKRALTKLASVSAQKRVPA